jgi:hypothetical protein
MSLCRRAGTEARAVTGCFSDVVHSRFELLDVRVKGKVCYLRGV